MGDVLMRVTLFHCCMVTWRGGARRFPTIQQCNYSTNQLERSYKSYMVESFHCYMVGRGDELRSDVQQCNDSTNHQEQSDSL